MSWNDYYRRRDILDAVLKGADEDPSAPVPFAEIDGAEKLFGTEERLLLALYYRWTQLLTGNLRAAVGGPEDFGLGDETDTGADRSDAVAHAWRETARDHQTLRAVLDANIDRYPALVSALHAEQRVLAITAGLVSPFEPVNEITKVGASFMALIRHSGPAGPRQGRAAGQLLRLLSSAS